MAYTLMIQGTASSVGKSLLVTALCRIFARRGLRVAPFKAQNMALNAGVTADGLEMGRAQIVQAEAAGIEPRVEMNPILLKPEADARSQVVVMGRPWRSVPAGRYYRHREKLWRYVVEALDKLRAEYDLVIVEGAGSPAEINLKAGDLVNMAVATYLNAPVLLVGDIDRGGVFAALFGTLALLEPPERELVRGFLINKFRGDRSLLEPGLRMFSALTDGRPVVGVIPYLPDLRIAQEDSVYVEEHRELGEGGEVEIAVIQFPHMANYDDVDALAMEPGVRVRFVRAIDEWGTPDAVILPGSKTTLADLRWLWDRGLAHMIRAWAVAGRAVVGICGGYQMLGRSVEDPQGVEGSPGKVDGVGLLPIRTVLTAEKRTTRTRGVVLGGEGFLSALRGVEVEGYEIHMGCSTPDIDAPVLLSLCDGGGDGTFGYGGRVWGTYLHGIFDLPVFRRAWLRSLGWSERGIGRSLQSVRQESYDRLADRVEVHLDMALLEAIVFSRDGGGR